MSVPLSVRRRRHCSRYYNDTEPATATAIAMPLSLSLSFQADNHFILQRVNEILQLHILICLSVSQPACLSACLSVSQSSDLSIYTTNISKIYDIITFFQ